jgi:hypothetical protein
MFSSKMTKKNSRKIPVFGSLTGAIHSFHRPISWLQEPAAVGAFRPD